MQCELLVLVELTPDTMARFVAAGCVLHQATTPAERAAKIGDPAANIRAVLARASR